MRLRFARVAATATAMSLVGAATLVATPAHAATPGIGTSAATSALLDVAVGQLMNLKVLADDARSTIDPSVAQPEAFSRLNALSLTTALPAPLNNISLPVVESRSPNGNGNVAGPGLNLTSLLPVNLPGVSSILGGVMQPAALTSSLKDGVATSALTSSLGNINLVGGLISATGLQSVLGTTAKGAVAEGNRTIKLDSIKVLDLGALLNGLGLPLANLPLDAVSNILKTLGVPVAGIPTGGTLVGIVDTLDGTIDAVLATVDGVTDTVDQVVNQATAGILGGLGLPLPQVGQTLDTVLETVQDLKDMIIDVLKGALSALDNLSLLSIEGLEVGTVTKAGDTVANSVSDIVAKIGAIKIGGLTLPGLDLGATLDQVNGVLNTVNNTLGSVLGSISPDLANLVKVNLFAKDGGVTKEGGYVKSLAGVSALTAKIVPPLNLGAILNGLTAGNGIGGLLTGSQLGGTLPVLDTVMGTLGGVLGGVTSVLSEGATIKLASVQSGASFTTPVASTNGTLPRTGGTAQMAMLGMALAIAALAGRRFVLANRVNA